jgi:hypothetical protein
MPVAKGDPCPSAAPDPPLALDRTQEVASSSLASSIFTKFLQERGFHRCLQVTFWTAQVAEGAYGVQQPSTTAPSEVIVSVGCGSVSGRPRVVARAQLH